MHHGIVTTPPLLIYILHVIQPRPQGLLRTWRVKNEKTLVKAAKISTIHGHFSACAKANLPWR